MKLIFAFYNVEFAKQLKGNMEANDAAQIIEIVSSEEDLINVIANNPLVDGVLISTDIATKLGNRNLELFVDILLVAREKFPQIVFSILSSERLGHPLHAELVEMGIYNIFIKDSDSVSVPLLLNSFKEQHSFSSAVRHRRVDDSIPWRRNFNRKSTVRVEFAEGQEVAQEESESAQNVLIDDSENKKNNWPGLSNREKRIPEIKKERPEEVYKDWFDESQINTLAGRGRIIGTVVIAVGSVAPHLGTTHTSISIASTLKKKGYLVALVEANGSQDFDRIHSLHEGEVNPILSEQKFDMNGIEHYKYRGEEFLQELFANYEFVVLDLGDMELTDFEDEFRRAHVRAVLCSGHEWKFHWIEDFRKRFFNEDDIFYLIPHGTPTVVSDLQERLPELEVVSVPTHPNPYKPSKDGEEFAEHLLSGFLKGNGRTFTKSALVKTGVISIVVTVVIMSAFLFI
ncbi:hypothetical protein V6B14_22245 (plasmid) [Sporosarcina psychrophila]|uniref:hypothetical protein n=1 Tax=Sporosarcina psychrophila TaxID=1476 RepID=UPI0030CACFD7